MSVSQVFAQVSPNRNWECSPGTARSEHTWVTGRTMDAVHSQRLWAWEPLCWQLCFPGNRGGLWLFFTLVLPSFTPGSGGLLSVLFSDRALPGPCLTFPCYPHAFPSPLPTSLPPLLPLLSLTFCLPWLSIHFLSSIFLLVCTLSYSKLPDVFWLFSPEHFGVTVYSGFTNSCSQCHTQCLV